MEYNHILELIKTVSESNLTNFHYEEGNVKIHMSCGDVADYSFAQNKPEESANVVTPVAKTELTELDNAVAMVAEPAKTVASANAKTIKSPLVGTFYAAPSEDAEPFVKVGDRVTKGQIVAIVEAMKLMNEIEAEQDGIIKEILVANATGVEYGEALFVIE